MQKIDLSKIGTEQRNTNSTELYQFDTMGILTIINNENAKIAAAVQAQLPTITKVIDLIFTRFHQGGRLIYMGARTSGRLGILDDSEMLPTYGLKSDQIIGIIAEVVMMQLEPQLKELKMIVSQVLLI